MTPQIENLIQQIGSELLTICQCEPKTAMLYAEFEDGVVSPSVFFSTAGSSKSIFKFAGQTLPSLAYELRDNMATLPNGEKWRAMVYSVRDGKLNVRAIFAEHFDETLDENRRRLAAAAEVLGEHSVDYSNP